jgi:hypothetical protein
VREKKDSADPLSESGLWPGLYEAVMIDEVDEDGDGDGDGDENEEEEDKDSADDVGRGEGACCLVPLRRRPFSGVSSSL